MTLKHTTLPLWGERVQDKEETEEHDSSPGGGSFLIVDIVSEADGEVVSGGHEHGDTNSNA